MAKSWIPTTSCNINIDADADAAAAATPNTNSNSNSSIESKALDIIVGLKILTNSKSKTNDHSKPIIFQRNQFPAATSFLKSCFLCHKHLSPNKDIYMYRGDQGFCSEECRSRQIYIDDVQQLEIKIILRQSQSRTTVNGRGHCTNHRTPPSKLHMSSPPVFS